MRFSSFHPATTGVQGSAPSNIGTIASILNAPAISLSTFIAKDGTVKSYLSGSWDAVTEATTYDIEINNGTTWVISSPVTSIKNFEVEIKPSPLTYSIRVKGSNKNGLRSGSWSPVSNSVVANGDVTPPGVVTGLSAFGSSISKEVTITWTDPTDLDYSHVKIYGGTVSSTFDPLIVLAASAPKGGVYKYNHSKTVATDLYYWVATVDYSGNESSAVFSYAINIPQYNPGAGFNADLLDGYHAVAFPRKDETATIISTWSFVSNASVSASDYYGASTWTQILSANSVSTQAALALRAKASSGNFATGSLHVVPVAEYRSGLVATYSADGSGAGYFAVNQFVPTSSTTLERLRVNVDGKLLIGAAAPVGDERVNINGRLRVGSFQSYNVGNATTFYGAENTGIETALQLHQSGVASARLGSKASDARLYITNDYNGNGLGNTATSIIIDSTGDVGIGVADPLHKLHIAGASGVDVIAKVHAGSANDAAILSLHGGREWRLKASDSDVDTSKFVIRDESVSSDRLVIDYLGNIGIGTSGPTAVLDVVGANADGGLQYRTSIRTVGIGQSSGEAAIYWGSGTKLNFTSGGAVPLSISSSNNVGIGTATPTEKLHVDGRIMVTSSGYTVNAVGGVFGYYSSTAPQAYIQAPANGEVVIWNDATAQIAVFTDSAKFGLGVTAPSDKMEVAGNIRSTTGGFYTTASGATVGMQLEGYVADGSYNSFILNNTPNTGSYAALNFGRLTNNLFGFIRSNNNAQTMEIGTAGLSRISIAQSGAVSVNGAFSHTGIITNAGGIKTYSVKTPNQGNVNSTYELMRISRDSVNWSVNMAYEITVYNAYYNSGGRTKWLLTYGYDSAGTLSCIDARGAQKFKVYLGAEVTVSGTIKYRPVLIDIPNYYEIHAEVKFNNNSVTSITESNQVHFTGTMTTGSGALYSGDTHLVPDGGNLGIGTTNPQHRLTVTGGNLAVESGSAYLSSSYALHFNYGVDNNYYINKNGTTLLMNTGGNFAMMNGRLGVGTTAPDGTLTVFNSATFDVRTSGINVHRPSSYGQFGSMSYDGDTTYFASTYTGGGSGEGGAFRFLSYDNSSPVDRFTIARATGNVAIGSFTDPAYQLEVGKTAGGVIAISTAGSAGLTASPLLTTLNFLGYSDKVKAAITAEDREGNVLGGWLNFHTMDTGNVSQKRVTIDPNGFFGIGTATPQYRLDVNKGSAGFQASFGSGMASSGEISGIHFGYAEAGNALYRKSALVFERSDAGIGDARGKIHLLNAISGSASATLADAKFTIDAAGNIGIGTQSPTNRLHVSTSIANNVIQDALLIDTAVSGGSSPSYYGSIRFRGNDYDWGAIRNIQTNPSVSWTSRMAFFTMNGNGGSLLERLSIDNAGNIGIGVTSPSQKLHVDGMTQTTALYNTNWNRSQTAYGYIDFGPANEGHGHIYTDRPTFYFNKEIFINGGTVWHSGNDGASSGLDSDLLDGLQASAFMQLAEVQTASGRKTFSNAVGTTVGDIYANSYTNSAIEVFSGASNKPAYMSYHITGVVGVTWGLNTNGWMATNATGIQVNGNSVWHAGNDGSGSGLDADLLDGYHSASAATGNTIALRDGSGNLFARDFTASRGDGTGVIYLNGAQTRYLYYDGSTYNMPGGGLNIGGAFGSGAITSSGSVTASGAGGFISATYQSNTRNPIWRFGNADGYGLSYFQNTAGYGSADSIGFHFGTATSAGSIVNITASGIVINGNSVWHAGNDGSGSGLDADLLKGKTIAEAATADTIVSRNGGGRFSAIGIDFYGSSIGDLVNSAPWYGVGKSDITSFGGGGNVIQMAGYYGLRIRSLNSTMDFYQNGRIITAVPTNKDFRVDGIINATRGIIDYSVDDNSSRPARILIPEGGARVASAGPETGAIKIELPADRYVGNSMMTFTVCIYEYATGKTRRILCGGYNYSYWVYTSAIQQTESGGNINVRFGRQSSRDCVWIGETNTVWNYPQVWIEDVNIGYSGFSNAWATGWAISLVTSFGTVENTHVAYAQWHGGNDGAGSGLDADLLDGYHASLGASGANSIPVRNGDGWLNQRVIQNVDSGSDGMYIGYGNSNSGATRIYGGGSTSANLTIQATSMTAPGEVYTPSGSYFRAVGTGGFYCETYNGGWNMTDGTWLRSIADKGILTGGAIQGATVTATSDLRLKENVTDLSHALDLVLAMQPRRFNWKKDGRSDIGAIAQELELIVPEVVYNGADDTKTVNYGALGIVAIAAIQELHEIVATLKARIKTLERK